MIRSGHARMVTGAAALVLAAACAGTTSNDGAVESGSPPVTVATTADTTAPTTVAPRTDDGDAADRQNLPTSEPTPVDVDVSCTTCDTGGRTITVGGMGEEFGPPDRAVVEIGVSARRPTVNEAAQQAANAGAALVAALGELGVAETDIQTSQFNIHPQHDPNDYTQIVGYQTDIGYRVTVRDVSALGSVMGRAVEAGGDSVRAWSVGFAGDPDGRTNVARAEAWDDVRSRAAATADQIGAPLGDVLDVHEKVLVTSPHGMRQGGEGDTASFDIPTSPGVVGVIVLLTVTYSIGT